MMIDKLKPIEPIENVNKTQKPRKMEKVDNADSISISAESQRLSEAYLAKKVAMAAPDVREDKIAEVAKKLENPDYIKNAIESMAQKFVDGFEF